MQARAPAEEEEEYLKQGIADGRFVWPPPESAKYLEDEWGEEGGADVDCERCKRLKFAQ